MKKIVSIAAAALIAFSASAQKIGYVNFQEIVYLTSDADAARAQLAASQAEAQETFQSMVDEYQGKASQYQQKSATWTPAIKESKEKELVEIQNRIQEFQQTIQQELDQQQSALMAPIIEKVRAELERIAKAEGVTVVLDSSSAYYFDASSTVDLTRAVRSALDIPEDRTLESLQQQLAAQAEQ